VRQLSRRSSCRQQDKSRTLKGNQDFLDLIAKRRREIMRKRLLAGLLMGVVFLFATSGFASIITGVTIEYVNSEYYANGWDLKAEHVVDGSGLVGSGHNQIQYPGGNSCLCIAHSILMLDVL